MTRIPVVFYHGKSFNLVTFGVFSTLASVVGYSIAFFYLYCNGILLDKCLWVLVLFFVFPNLVCAKLFSMFAVGIKDFFKDLWYHLNQTSFYQQGGIFGFIIGTLCLVYFLRISFFMLSDAICLGGFATMFIGRLGCYNYGCCVGKPAHGNRGIVYSDPEAKICREVPEFKGITLIPVQLMASGIDLLLFCLCCGVVRILPFSGIITIIFFLCLNMKRITLQPLRWKDPSNRISYQWIAVSLMLTITFLILFFYSSGEVMFREEKLKCAFNLENYYSSILADPRIMFPLLTGGMINFIAYGVHGKKLGTYFNIKP